MHRNHPTKWNVDLRLAFGKHLVFLHNLCSVDLVHLDTLDYHVKR
jgi:hypothetical protein